MAFISSLLIGAAVGATSTFVYIWQRQTLPEDTATLPAEQDTATSKPDPATTTAAVTT